MGRGQDQEIPALLQTRQEFRFLVLHRISWQVQTARVPQHRCSVPQQVWENAKSVAGPPVWMLSYQLARDQLIAVNVAGVPDGRWQAYWLRPELRLARMQADNFLNPNGAASGTPNATRFRVKPDWKITASKKMAKRAQ